jgi:SAM-dependent methyltransferase
MTKKSRPHDAYAHLPRKAHARNELRKRSFDSVAELYDKARPTYPEELFDDLVELSGIPPDGRILEIGPGTGQATLPLAGRGFSILGLELGKRLTALAAKKLERYPKVEIRNVAFEDWKLERKAFDVVLAATAFHWIRPGTGFARAAAALKPGGSLALLWNFGVVADDDLRSGLRRIYRRYAPKIRNSRPPEQRIRKQAEKITGSGHFERATVCRFPWERAYATDEYIGQLMTQSDHILLDAETQRNLYQAIRALIDRRGIKITVRVIAALFLARKKTQPPTATRSGPAGDTMRNRVPCRPGNGMTAKRKGESTNRERIAGLQ